MNEQKPIPAPHLITLENREQITLSGVHEVESFDEEAITMKTELGVLCIRGSKLHICAFDVASGQLRAQGKIAALVYAGEHKSGGLLSRVFK